MAIFGQYRDEGGRTVTDWDGSFGHVQPLERRGIPVIGLYPGTHASKTKRMRKLFPHLVTCHARELPDKLGNLLSSPA